MRLARLRCTLLFTIAYIANWLFIEIPYDLRFREGRLDGRRAGGRGLRNEVAIEGACLNQHPNPLR